jgi:hypothetical protein
MRFRSPARDAVPRGVFDHPAYAPFLSRAALLVGPWPAVEALNANFGAPCHARSAASLRFVAQTPALLTDGLHYETRIHDAGLIATRAANWHDLFNALMWMERFALKCAVNAAYVREAARDVPGPRTRPQCALTHFDEAGALVVLRDASLLDAWDSHDWPALFHSGRERWQADAHLVLFGHALLEHLLWPGAMPVAKCLVMIGDDPLPACSAVADAIASGKVLCDPAELRPLPLAGLAGWHPDHASEHFVREAACFRPRRPDRVYPAPLRTASSVGRQ